jgi:glycosyltransferase involved in cell wall biosynthesis
MSEVVSRVEPITVSVVLPTLNERAHIRDCLDSLLAQDYDGIVEILVVDGCSTDGTREVVVAEGGLVTLVDNPERSAAAAMNVGIRAASGDIIVRLDGHSRPHADYVRRCIERLQDANAGVVGGVWHIVPGAPTLRARAIALATGSRLGSGGAAYRHGEEEPAPRDADTVPFGAFARGLWQALDGYDSELLVVEDGDFNYRTRAAGRRVILDPAIKTEYFPRRRFRTLARQYLGYGWWKMVLLRKHPGALRVRQIIPFGFVAVVLALAFASAVSPSAKTALLALLAVYAVVLLAAAFMTARRAQDVRLWLPIALAYLVIQCSWGLGGLLHVITLGQLPRWRVTPTLPRT